MVDKITYNDLKEYDFLFTMTPSFLMGAVIKRNTNVVKKFNSTVKSNLDNLNEKQKKQLNIIINTDIEELQEVLEIAYKKTHKKQYKLLSDYKARDFIKLNLDELKKLI